MSEYWNSKKECRSFYKNLCAEKFAQGLVQNQEQLNTHLLQFLSRKQGLWGAYQSLPFEAAVEVATQQSSMDWVFPRIRGEHLEFCQARSFAEGPFGLSEPCAESQQVDLSQVKGLLIPGLVFNKNGTRLGKGKGYYDRALVGFSGTKVGVCFDFQISDKLIPHEPHDIMMDYLISESGVIECRKQK